jgi:hypothetical protein
VAGAPAAVVGGEDHGGVLAQPLVGPYGVQDPAQLGVGGPDRGEVAGGHEAGGVPGPVGVGQVHEAELVR